jgi:hypothetical protein
MLKDLGMKADEVFLLFSVNEKIMKNPKGYSCKKIYDFEICLIIDFEIEDTLNL